MTIEELLKLITNAQVSTALVLIAASLVYIAFKLSERKRTH